MLVERCAYYLASTLYYCGLCTFSSTVRTVARDAAGNSTCFAAWTAERKCFCANWQTSGTNCTRVGTHDCPLRVWRGEQPGTRDSFQSRKHYVKRYVFSFSHDSSSVLGRRVYSHHQQCGYSLQTRLRGKAHAACSWQEICFQEM